MSSQRPVYIPRKRKAVRTNVNNPDPAASKRTTENNYETRRRLQKQQQPRFHGAFTGGFSAGYFNTVGTKEGWKPSQVKKRDQRLEDFMDEEDHANWGGPTRLRGEYRTKSMAPTESSALKDHDDPTGDSITSPSTSTIRAPFLPIKSMLEVSHQTVGPRLLRRLGWREGGSAIVPENATTATNIQGKGVENEDKNTLENLAKVHLSLRKLRKIQLQSSRMKLPPPKLDKCGLGFEPYKDAPEFQQYREKRKQQARDRASYNSKVNVYRVSDVATKVEGDENSNAYNRAASSRHPRDSSGGGEYLSYETAEDFVGKRSAAGFALRDDEDDAYDEEVDTYKLSNDVSKSRSARPKSFSTGDEYNTEVYEHESSGDEYDQNPISQTSIDTHAPPSKNKKNNNNKSVDVGSMFAAWAGTDQSFSDGKASSIPRAGLTSDGKPPLAGFVLGDSMDINKRRYPGPSIPRDYTIHRHEFGEHENPYVLEAISNAVRLEQKEERRSQLRQQEESQRQIQQKRDESSLPLSNNFSTLAEAMKRRFTSSTEESSEKGESTTETPKALPAGLHMPRPVENKEDRSKDDKNVSKPKSDIPKVTITRTTKSFFPNPLVCKRFRVLMPTNARRNTGLIAADKTRNNESVYFEREILGKAKQLDKKKGSVQNDDDAQKLIPESKAEEIPKGIDRPSIENLRKIFQASSDESSSGEDDESVDDSNKAGSDQSLKDTLSNVEEDRKYQALRKDDTPTKDGRGLESEEEERKDEDDYSSRSSDNDDDESSRARASRKRRKERRRRKHSHHRKRHQRKRSRSKDRDYYSDGSSSYEDNGEDERRKERHSRDYKKRKKKKSSRHKSRKRERSEKI